MQRGNVDQNPADRRHNDPGKNSVRSIVHFEPNFLDWRNVSDVSRSTICEISRNFVLKLKFDPLAGRVRRQAGNAKELCPSARNTVRP
jgi:hypothetical protein